MPAIQHLISVSGGKDSTAVYLLGVESGRPFRAVFADTGNEHELTYEYIATLHDKTGGPRVETVRADFSSALEAHRDFITNVWPTQDIPDDIVREAAELNTPSGNPYLDLCILKGRFPSRMAQFCTSELKEYPIVAQMVLPMLRKGPVLQWLGIRAEESLRRAKQPRFNHHESGSVLWRPIFRWTLKDVWEQHRRHAIKPNTLYGMGMNRVGCMPCINCRKSELAAISQLFPDHIERIARWERLVSAASKRGASSFFAPINGDILGIHQATEWAKTGRGGRQYDLFFSAQESSGCSSNLALCEASA